jgi:hypothetical protein
LPKSHGKLRRSQALVQPCDLYFTLAELLGAVPSVSGFAGPAAGGFGRSALSLLNGRSAWRDRALVAGAGGTGIRTPAWYLVQDLAGDPDATTNDEADPQPRLYAKPDDWWEVNDVADRCPDIVERLAETRRETIKALAEGRPVEPLPADDPLSAGLS